MNIHSLFLVCGFVFLVHLSPAQDSTVYLPTMTVQATRQLETYATATRSIYIQQHDIVASEPGLSLQRVLRGIPGIQISERGHYALGERILIRGMGYRAAFGVRGLQAFLNGIPLTMPDGQSMLDVVDPVFIGSSELLRGPSSLFWGNASGGVLHLVNVQSSSPLRLRYMRGSYGLNHVLASTGLKLGPHQIQAYASLVEKDGYRAHSKGDFFRAGLSTRTIPSPKTILLVTLNAAIQDVLSPGSLTLEQLSFDPRQADPRYVTTAVGKASTHLQGGVTLHTQMGLGNLSATAYGIRRSLENPLTFAWSELERIAGGLYAQFQMDIGSAVGFTTGIDLRQLQDDRVRFNNDAGRRGNRTLLDQQENVGSLAVFAGLSTQLSSRVGVSAGVRLDRLQFEMMDHLHTNGDQSGSRNFTALSPSLGLSYRTTSLTWYANWSTAFETPTTTELINSPSGMGGFNSDLNPQQTRGMEVGMRGQLDDLKLKLDFALFSLRINDRLLPQQGEDGRTWYSNGGKNRHNGAELALEWPVDSPLHAQITYSYGSFIFLNDPGDGLEIPGVPAHQFHLSLHGSTSKGWSGQVVLESASEMWGNNANSAKSDGFTVLDVYLAYSDWDIGRITLHPFVRIQNILDSQYVRSLVVNAFGGRYFEPAEGRSIQGGIGISL
ncbi:MAG: TonB-dependent receptor [Rhodothermaceae bacterium]|nr:TonB-dependent receptor [Rhodothermaceae bacterium]MXZ57062.1 TonB-dependent receptor [Rhodothermaceae bacterium]MYB90794.1 TonB-dependent receptor [Rhodothermaceae bacterium]MYD68647.1 TonB-dependent receptor [Rhodothermaceae bacterium]MYG45238.1 TonB-dependent receptor [Rhodothermaceae bacterium]